MALNISDPLPIHVNGEPLPTTDEFTYLGSTVRHDGGAVHTMTSKTESTKPGMPSEC